MSPDYYALYLLLGHRDRAHPGPGDLHHRQHLTRGQPPRHRRVLWRGDGHVLVAATYGLAGGDLVYPLAGHGPAGDPHPGGRLLPLLSRGERLAPAGSEPGDGAVSGRIAGAASSGGGAHQPAQPKAIIFFASLFPQFIDFRQGVGQCLLLALTFSAVVLVVHSGYCLVFRWVGAQGLWSALRQGSTRCRH